MRFERSDSFKSDYRRLSDAERAMVRAAVVDFSEACDRFVEQRTPFPSRLRVKDVKGAPGVFEMTWSFAGPDCRATWEWIEVSVADEGGSVEPVPAVRWRRIGGHEVFRRP